MPRRTQTRNTPPPPRKTVDQQFAEARQMMKKEMPVEEAGVTIEQAPGYEQTLWDLATRAKNFFTGSQSTGIQAATHGLGPIHYSQQPNEGRGDQEIADTLAHELTHRRQFMQDSMGSDTSWLPWAGLPYHQRAPEIDAFNAEVARAASQGRTTQRPYWETGQPIQPGDVALPSPAEDARVEQRRAALLQRLGGRK